ncbi:MAG TPA: ABC transporter permease subunit [Egibacteraceae bacterium]|nr:ABC transporter permease subunit [Egibacteraceae bacterium]
MSALYQAAAVAQTGEALIRWDWVMRHDERIRALFLDHVELTAIPVLLGLAIAFPLSLSAVRWPRLYAPLLAGTGLLFTIPSLALFVLLLPFTGLSRTTAIIPLTLYTLLVLTRNIVEGFRGVSDDVSEAAEAMGYTRPRRLVNVELPLALPVIIAGVRIATVTTVGLVTVTAVIGQGGLGRLFLEGLRFRDTTPLLVGVAGCIVLAVLADLALLAAERHMTPWTRRARS